MSQICGELPALWYQITGKYPALLCIYKMSEWVLRHWDANSGCRRSCQRGLWSRVHAKELSWCIQYRGFCRSLHSYVLFTGNSLCVYTPVVYRQALDTIFRTSIYPMLNRWNANPVTPNPGLRLVESNEDSYEYWWEHISFAYLSKVKSTNWPMICRQ